MAEIYSRPEYSSAYRESVVEIDDEVSTLILQIENLLSTSQRSVLGVPSYGINLEDLIFDPIVGGNAIERTIAGKIHEFCPLSTTYDVLVSVDFYYGERADTADISITINGIKAISIIF